MSKQPGRSYEFGRFRIDAAERRLMRDGETVLLPPKAFDTLLALVEHSGHLLQKDVLMRTVWPDAFVEENNLTQHVYVLRKVLGEGGGEKYIETVPRIGYRFNAVVREVSEEAADLFVENRTKYRVVVKEESYEEDYPEQTAEAQVVEAQALSVPLPDLRRQSKPKYIVLAVSLVLVGLAAALIWTTGKTKRDERGGEMRPAFKSLAVLPFKTIGEHNEHLGIGVADTVIARLSQIRQISVRPISAVHRFTGLGQDPIAAGRALGVDAVLDGRVQRADGRLRVTVELLSVRDGSVLWTETLDEHSNNIFTLQDTIAARVAGSLPAALTGEERTLLARRYTTSPEAYEAYLKGRFFWNKRTPEGFGKAVDHFRQAIAFDPNYALAYAGLADCYALQSEYTSVSPQEAVPKAKEAALKALGLDDTLAEAHASLAYVLANYEWKWAEAEAEFKRAIELNPSYATAHQWYAEMLHVVGRDDEAGAELARARELDPLSLIIKAMAASGMSTAGQHDKAIEELRETLKLDPNFTAAHYYMAVIYERSGQYEKALAEFQRMLDETGHRMIIAQQGRIYAALGRRGEALKVLGELREMSKRQHVQSYDLARIYARLGEKDQALAELQKSFQERYRFLTFANVDPDLESLRPDPRFQDLLRRMNLAA